MAQSAAAYSYGTASSLREELVEEYIVNSPQDNEITRRRAEETFVVVNHTQWMPPNTVRGDYAYNHAEAEEFRPNEWSTLQVRELGEKGLRPETVQAVAAVGFGLEQPYDNSEEGTRVYNLSSYGRFEAPAWEFSDPNQSGVDESRPGDERDEQVNRFLSGVEYTVPGFEDETLRDEPVTCE